LFIDTHKYRSMLHSAVKSLFDLGSVHRLDSTKNNQRTDVGNFLTGQRFEYNFTCVLCPHFCIIICIPY